MPSNDFLSSNLRELPFFRALIRSVESTFYQSLKLPSPTLDVGCGDGQFAGSTFHRRMDAGLDPGLDSLREARRFDAYGILVSAAGERMPFRSAFFASAFSNSVLEHILQVGEVLGEVARVLQPGAPFYFCVPNPRYISELSISRLLGKRYADWFRRISRVRHADEPETWEKRLQHADLELIKWWHYFPPPSMHVLEWGHYLGLPSLLARKVTGKWILSPAKWNLRLTERVIKKYAVSEPVKDGVFTFYIARRR